MALMSAGIAAAVAFLGALLMLPWEPALITEPFVRDTSNTRNTAPQDEPGFSRRTVYFPSHGTRLEGWLYLPKGQSAAPPVVIMAHGIAGQKDMGLQPFAEAFANAGLAVLLFDYRCFGGSDGEPRNWVSPARHLQDWNAALGYVRTSLGAEVDATRVGLWGTSFAGGHVLCIARAQGTNISAVVAQVPFLSGIESSRQSLVRRGVLRSVRMFLAGLQDRFREAIGLTPAYLPVAGLPGQLAFMELGQDELALYFAKHPKKYEKMGPEARPTAPWSPADAQGGWQNRILARLVNEMTRYNPAWDVPYIKAPTLMVVATNDSLCPLEVARRATASNEKVRLVEKGSGHFDVYVGELFEEVAAEQAKFFLEAFEAPAPVTEPAEAMPLL